MKVLQTNDLKHKLNIDDLISLPPVERARHLESYMFRVLEKNKQVGCTQAELEKMTGLSGPCVARQCLTRRCNVRNRL